jgi:hypothetical protein
MVKNEKVSHLPKATGDTPGLMLKCENFSYLQNEATALTLTLGHSRVVELLLAHGSAVVGLVATRARAATIAFF